MIMNQRWRAGRDHYRPAGETIKTSAYDVATIADDTTPKAFVIEHHYSGTYPAARFRFGLYRVDVLVGVAVFSHPCSDRVLTSVFSGPVMESVELGRFVLLDDVPGNGETWFLARCFELLRSRGIRGVVSFADPIPRLTLDGGRISPGHVGTIYQAHNGRYLGRGTARTLRLLPDAKTLSDRALQKIRSGDRGWRYAAELLERAGAPPAPADTAQRVFWLRTHLPRCTRSVRHPGNYKYAWCISDKRIHRRLESKPYPKD